MVGDDWNCLKALFGWFKGHRSICSTIGSQAQVPVFQCFSSFVIVGARVQMLVPVGPIRLVGLLELQSPHLLSSFGALCWFWFWSSMMVFLRSSFGSMFGPLIRVFSRNRSSVFASRSTDSCCYLSSAYFNRAVGKLQFVHHLHFVRAGFEPVVRCWSHVWAHDSGCHLPVLCSSCIVFTGAVVISLTLICLWSGRVWNAAKIEPRCSYWSLPYIGISKSVFIQNPFINDICVRLTFVLLMCLATATLLFDPAKSRSPWDFSFRELTQHSPTCCQTLMLCVFWFVSYLYLCELFSWHGNGV